MIRQILMIRQQSEKTVANVAMAVFYSHTMYEAYILVPFQTWLDYCSLIIKAACFIKEHEPYF